MNGVWVLIAVLVAATAFGVWNRRTSGRISNSAVRAKGVPSSPDADPTADLLTVLAGRLGERATVVQFSSAFCQPCRATRRILEEVAVMVPGVAHVEIDAEDNLGLVRALDIRRTPTVLFLDGGGLVRKRASGQPRKADVIAALGEILPA